MPAFAEKYTDEQREAMAVAFVDLGMRPAIRVVEAARRGELTLDGRKVGAFTPAEQSVRHYGAQLKKRRAGLVRSGMEATSPRDAVEALRMRLVRMTDAMLAAEENKPASKRDPERVRQLARATREIAALPGPGDKAPTKPGDKIPGTQQTEGGKTRGGLAGAILSAARSNAAAGPEQAPAPETPHGQGRNTDQGDARTAAGATASTNEQGTDTEQQGGPGSWVREQAAVLEGAGY